MNVKLSVVIPTQNRASTCVPTVRALLTYDESFEIVVYDSSIDTSWRAELPRDSRLRVEAGPAEQNITQCFENAAAHACGEYVCMIGDDDGITPSLFQACDLARQSNLDSLSTHPSSFALYNWPDVRSKYFGATVSGKLFLHRAAVPELQPLDLLDARRTFLAGAAQGCGLMPRIYHGIVRRTTLEAMRRRFGRCFAGVSPDVSFSYLASLSANSHALSSTPLTISGSSATSNAGRSAMRTHQGALWSDPHMKYFQQEQWPSVVPAFFSVETVWAQAVLSAMDLAGGADRALFDIERLYAILSLRHRSWRHETRRSRAAALAERESGWTCTGWSFATRRAAVACAEVASLGRRALRKVLPAHGTEVLPASSLGEATAIVRQRFVGS